MTKIEDNKIAKAYIKRLNEYRFLVAQEIAELLNLDIDDIAGELYRNETDVIYALRNVILNNAVIEVRRNSNFNNSTLVIAVIDMMRDIDSIIDFPGINFDMFNLAQFYRFRVVEHSSKYPTISSYEDMINVFKDLSSSLPEDKYKVTKWILNQLR